MHIDVHASRPTTISVEERLNVLEEDDGEDESDVDIKSDGTVVIDSESSYLSKSASNTFSSCSSLCPVDSADVISDCIFSK